MAAPNFMTCLAKVLKHEGGYVNHPKDPGGETNKGVTKAVYDAYRKRKGLSVRSVRNITDAEVSEIYKEQYWDRVRGDDLPAGLDYVAFDGGVNSGPSRGAKWLQQGIGSIKADGVVGLITIEAARKANDKAAVVRKACEARRSFLRGLSTFATFGKGWMNRVAGVEADAVTMVMRSQSLTPEVIAKELEQYADEAAGKSQANAGKAGAAGAAGAGAPTVPATTDLVPWDTSALVVVGIFAIVLIGVALVFWRNSRAEAAVSDAYAAKAKELLAELKGG